MPLTAAAAEPETDHDPAEASRGLRDARAGVRRRPTLTIDAGPPGSRRASTSTASRSRAPDLRAPARSSTAPRSPSSSSVFSPTNP